MTPQEGVQGQGNGDRPDVYTMRQLNQRTASVINRVIEKNGPALITRLGRFVAVIMPLGQDLESRVLSEIAREIVSRGPDTSSQVNHDKPEVYTIRQLGQQTAFVIEQIERKGLALITRNGHFVATISPLRGDVESRVLSEAAREIGRPGPDALPQHRTASSVPVLPRCACHNLTAHPGVLLAGRTLPLPSATASALRTVVADRGEVVQPMPCNELPTRYDRPETLGSGQQLSRLAVQNWE